MPRIVVIGNCQADSIAESMRFMAPDSFVKSIISWETGQWYANEQAIFDDIHSFDHVFAHDVAIAGTSVNNFEDLKAVVPHAIKVPTIVFPAFHPDLVYVTIQEENSSQLLISPIGAYNSALALMAYKMGLTARHALALFDERVYEKLGYFDLWADSQAALLQSGRECGIKLDEAFSRWARKGCFMFSINHACIEPMADIAMLLLQKAGINAETDVCDRFVADPAQADAIWPLYPPIAARMGLKGNYMFKRPNYSAKDGNKYFTLESFVHESFKTYKFTPARKISCERVDAWLQNKPLVDWILSFIKNSVRN